MIRLGLTSFAEHEMLTKKKISTLYEYAGYLPLVELDTAYYGIPKSESVKRWAESVPDNFRFVVKVYSGISGQNEWQRYYENEAEMFVTFFERMQPLIDSGKLFTFLIQFPGHFACTKENVTYLEKIHRWFEGYPVAVELRNASWYSEKYVQKMRQFMSQKKLSLVIVDEPQLLVNSIPFDPYITNDDFVLFRFHGRNSSGWLANDKEWRKKRTLYKYNTKEIKELSKSIDEVAKKVQEIGVIFNNNSGEDAAGNLMDMKKILRIDYEELNPSQIDLF